jgi:uncharacterized peroxidase-related enzyme
MFIAPPENADGEGDLARWYSLQRQLWGYLPNYAPIFAGRPEVGLAWAQLSSTIRAGMDRRRYELATVAAARALGSTYCLAAHSKFLRDDCGDEATMRAVAGDPTGAALDPVDRAVVGFATAVATDPTGVSPEHVQRLRDVGLTDGEVADLIFAVAARCFFATVLDAAGAEPDRQLAETLDPDVRDRLTVGRPFAGVPGEPPGAGDQRTVDADRPS